MSEFDDQDLEERVNNAVGNDDAEDDRGDINEDDTQERGSEDDAADDDATEVNSDDDDEGDRSQKSRSNGSDDEGDDEDDDYDPALDYARPDFGNGSPDGAKEFDIRTLPRDENGNIDPVEANRLINEHYSKQGQAGEAEQKRLNDTRQLLTTQWQRVADKYPGVAKNKELRALARDMHMNSIGTDNYLTPVQAAQRVDKIRARISKTGYKQAKTRKTVERMVRTEGNSGRSSSSGKQSAYDDAKKMAQSRDPAKAKEGRLMVMRLRREARQRRG